MAHILSSTKILLIIFIIFLLSVSVTGDILYSAYNDPEFDGTFESQDAMTGDSAGTGGRGFSMLLRNLTKSGYIDHIIFNVDNGAGDMDSCINNVTICETDIDYFVDGSDPLLNCSGVINKINNSYQASSLFDLSSYTNITFMSYANIYVNMSKKYILDFRSLEDDGDGDHDYIFIKTDDGGVSDNIRTTSYSNHSTVAAGSELGQIIIYDSTDSCTCPAITNSWVHTDPNLVGWYRLNDHANDISNTQLNGQLLNDTTYVDSIFYRGGYFDGNYDSINLSNTNNPFNITKNFTISAWINPKASDEHRAILNLQFSSSSAAARNAGIKLRLNAYEGIELWTMMGLYPHNTTQYTVTSNDIINANEWVHVVATVNGTTAKIYLNGQLNVTNSNLYGADINWDGDAYDWDLSNIGSWAHNIGTYTTVNGFYGTLDEIIIFNRALSSTEVTTLYDNSPYDGANWDILASDNCELITDCDITAYNTTISGTGTFTLSANLTTDSVAISSTANLINLAGDGNELRIVT